MKKIILRITNVFLFMAALVSCQDKPSTETIRLYVRAGDAYSMGRFAEVTEILHGQNNFPPALVLRAKAEYFAGNIDKAEMSCRRAVRLRPSFLEANHYLARILREKGDLAGAVETIESMLADNPQDIRTLRLAAELAMEIGKLDEAAVLLDRAAEYSAESAMVLLDRARLRWITGRGYDALDDLTRAKAMLPWDTPLMRSISSLENIIKEVHLK
ncbi:MAG: tetratricopeptide repeat protein [Treponema sp.]|nr:tetratricopeptide repeat protein [Treponema sp.]